MIIGVIDQLNMRIPPFIRTDLLQIIFTQGLSIGNLRKIYEFLCPSFRIILHALTIESIVYKDDTVFFIMAAI